MTYTPIVLTDCRIYLDSCDFTAWTNKFESAYKFDQLNSTTFGSGGYQARVAGEADTTVKVESFWQAGDTSYPDDTAFADLGLNTVAVTAIPAPSTGSLAVPAAGDLAYLTKVLLESYTVTGDVGQLLMANVDGAGNWPLVRGQVMHPYGTARTTTGTTTGQQIGAVTSTQQLYATLHVLSIAGTAAPSLAVKVQSSSTQGGSYTDRITFTTATAIGGQASSVVGAITDSWWRVSYTITGTNPSFLFAVSAGVAKK